jgi:excisionase family DNA binding protein
MKKADQKDFFTIPEVAKLIGLSRIAVYKQVKAGQIKAMRVGKIYLIRDRDLAQVLGKKLTPDDIRSIEKSVNKGIRRYGEVFKWLAHE